MKETGIIFSGPMALANIEGRKTQTRRTRGLEIINRRPMDFEYLHEHYEGEHIWQDKETLRYEYIKCPYGGPGDLIWQRETWWKPPFITHKMERDGADTWPEFVYDASEDDYTREEWSEWGWKKKPSIYMPRRVSRFKAKLISVRPERVQDITEEDARAEGIFEVTYRDIGAWSWVNGRGFNSPISAYRALWNSINAPKGLGWYVNPWVWRLEYEEVSNEPRF